MQKKKKENPDANKSKYMLIKCRRRINRNSANEAEKKTNGCKRKKNKICHSAQKMENHIEICGQGVGGAVPFWRIHLFPANNGILTIL